MMMLCEAVSQEQANDDAVMEALAQSTLKASVGTVTATYQIPIIVETVHVPTPILSSPPKFRLICQTRSRLIHEVIPSMLLELRSLIVDYLDDPILIIATKTGTNFQIHMINGTFDWTKERETQIVSQNHPLIKNQILWSGRHIFVRNGEWGRDKNVTITRIPVSVSLQCVPPLILDMQKSNKKTLSVEKSTSDHIFGLMEPFSLDDVSIVSRMRDAEQGDMTLRHRAFGGLPLIDDPMKIAGMRSTVFMTPEQIQRVLDWPIPPFVMPSPGFGTGGGKAVTGTLLPMTFPALLSNQSNSSMKTTSQTSAITTSNFIVFERYMSKNDVSTRFRLVRYTTITNSDMNPPCRTSYRTTLAERKMNCSLDGEIIPLPNPSDEPFAIRFLLRRDKPGLEMLTVRHINNQDIKTRIATTDDAKAKVLNSSAFPITIRIKDLTTMLMRKFDDPNFLFSHEKGEWWFPDLLMVAKRPPTSSSTFHLPELVPVVAKPDPSPIESDDYGTQNSAWFLSTQCGGLPCLFCLYDATNTVFGWVQPFGCITQRTNGLRSTIYVDNREIGVIPRQKISFLIYQHLKFANNNTTLFAQCGEFVLRFDHSVLHGWGFTRVIARFSEGILDLDMIH